MDTLKVTVNIINIVFGVTLFGSIMESMCRDIHCCCIRGNSSDYGDSRIPAPRKTALCDIILTKGGDHDSILAADIVRPGVFVYNTK